MRTRTNVIGIVTLLVIAAGCYYYSTVNAQFKKKSTALISKHILGEGEEIIEPKVEKEVYVLVKGTGIRYLNYAIPEIDTAFIRDALNAMYEEDGGKFWLSYIDRNGKSPRINSTIFWLNEA